MEIDGSSVGGEGRKEGTAIGMGEVDTERKDTDLRDGDERGRKYWRRNYLRWAPSRVRLAAKRSLRVGLLSYLLHWVRLRLRSPSAGFFSDVGSLSPCRCSHK